MPKFDRTDPPPYDYGRNVMSTTKTPEPKTPELDESGQAPPAGGSVGPPPSQSPFEPAPEEKDDKAKAHKDEKAPAHKDEKAHK
jgi:hypothetical protein